MHDMSSPITLDHAWIAAHIPHQGSMCLLDRVESWSETAIVCRANSHLRTDNPLRHAGRLGIANGIEYAAQAMAVHGALLAGDNKAPAAGFLTSVRNVRWHRQRLNDVNGELTVRAERLSGNELNILYAFSLHCADTLLLSGRASVMLDASGGNTSFINPDTPS
jgi:predicted hotdog family 3-hydroxylacyl-ACP dehydratase